MMKCDFCTEPDPDPSWTYPATPFNIDVFQLGIEVTQASDGRWLACATCHAFIEKNDLAGMVERSVHTFHERRFPMGGEQIKERLGLDEQQYIDALRTALTQFHGKFLERRSGPGTKNKPLAPIATRPEYVLAIEKQLLWYAFDQSAEAGFMWRRLIAQNAMDRMSRIACARVVALGDVFFVSKPIGQLVYRAARGLPAATFDRTMLPSEHGFVVFEDPIELPSLTPEQVQRVDTRMRPPTPAGFPLFFDVLGWTPTDDGAIEFVFLCTGSVNSPPGWTGTSKAGYWPLSYAGLRDGDDWRVRIAEFEAISGDSQYQSGICTCTHIVDEHVDRITDVDPATSERILNKTGRCLHPGCECTRYAMSGQYADKVHEIAFTMALLLFMQQRVLTRRRAHLPRSSRRRADRAGSPRSHIQVITLRRYAEYEKERPEGHHDVDWAYQWEVRGHWRQQPYRTQGIVKPIWIQPFTKGPPDKPFKDDQRRVFTVIR